MVNLYQRQTKVLCTVPLKLELQEFDSDTQSFHKKMYHLKSVVIREGSDIDEGHFYLFSRDVMTGAFIRYDDEYVTLEGLPPGVYMERSDEPLRAPSSRDTLSGNKEIYFLEYVAESHWMRMFNVRLMEKEEIPSMINEVVKNECFIVDHEGRKKQVQM